MKTKIKHLRPGDTIRFGAAETYTVERAEPHPMVDGLIQFTLLGTNFSGHVSIPADNDIETVSQPRIVEARCVLCKATSPYKVDLVQTGPNPDVRGLCEACDIRITAEALRNVPGLGD